MVGGRRDQLKHSWETSAVCHERSSPVPFVACSILAVFYCVKLGFSSCKFGQFSKDLFIWTVSFNTAICLLHTLLKVLIIPNNLQTWAAAILLERECSPQLVPTSLSSVAAPASFTVILTNRRTRNANIFFFSFSKSSQSRISILPELLLTKLHSKFRPVPQATVLTDFSKGLQQPHRMLQKQAQVVQVLHRNLPTAKSLTAHLFQ